MVSRGRIAITYLWRHGRWPMLDAPTTFTEFVQHRKLHDRDPRIPRLIDKVLVKAWVAERLGEEWVTPTLWHGSRLPAAPEWPAPFVVKSRHGCNQTLIVRTRPMDWAAIRRASERWLSGGYGEWLDEWGYSGLQPGLMVEPFIGDGGRLPIDYKFYVFAGRVAYVQVHLDREHRHRWLLLDRHWRCVSRPVTDRPAAPARLSDMIEAAELLGRGFDFVRVDLYAGASRPLFGEMSFYPGSGLDPFSPISLDEEMGRLWAMAAAASSAMTTPHRVRGAPLRGTRRGLPTRCGEPTSRA